LWETGEKGGNRREEKAMDRKREESGGERMGSGREGRGGMKGKRSKEEGRQRNAKRLTGKGHGQRKHGVKGVNYTHFLTAGSNNVFDPPLLHA